MRKFMRGSFNYLGTDMTIKRDVSWNAEESTYSHAMVSKLILYCLFNLISTVFNFLEGDSYSIQLISDCFILFNNFF